MNSEILFAVRFKAGGIGLGSDFANQFAPLGSGAAVVNGDGKGLIILPQNSIPHYLHRCKKGC
jgi:hypothetical protein